ncbi:MAG: hypothetical protein RLO21_05745, partial [Nitratireductor sp.]
YPEGDGVTFNRSDDEAYDPGTSLADFRACFPFLDLSALDKNEGLSAALARLAHGRTIQCRYLVPVEGLRLDEPLHLGKTRFHAQVNGDDVRLTDHAWCELCDVPGADVDPNWAPCDTASGTTELLAHPLIERTIIVPLDALYEATGSFHGESRLLRLLIEDADHALDPVRFTLCHFRRLQYLPAKPGWLGDTALAYVIPESRAVEARLIQGKPYVLRVSSTWLGLELDRGAITGLAEVLADVVDSDAGDAITLALKGALRAWNRSFYLVELEASFLQLVYAIDALCEPDKLRGDAHRIWIMAFASGGNAQRFDTLLTAFDTHYCVRNRIVHEGESFASLGVVGEEQCQFILDLLTSCIGTFLDRGFTSRREAAEFAYDMLTSAAVTPRLAAIRSKHFKLPLADDKGFTQHMQP